MTKGKAIGLLIRKRREKQNISLVNLATLARTSIYHICCAEHGVVGYQTPPLLRRIAENLGLPINYFLEGIANEPTGD